jgi:hypothetical protein
MAAESGREIAITTMERTNDAGTDGAPITLINVFEVDPEKLESVVAGWRERAELMRKRPGFRSLQLRRALRPDARFRSKLRDHMFAGMKRAGRWAMTEPQIEAAIEAMSIDARPADPPSRSGLSKHSRFGRRLLSQRGA